jgi:hypothetical protein
MAPVKLREKCSLDGRSWGSPRPLPYSGVVPPWERDASWRVRGRRVQKRTRAERKSLQPSLRGCNRDTGMGASWRAWGLGG